MRRRPTAAPLLLAGLLALGAVACGDSGSDGDDAVNPTSSTAASDGDGGTTPDGSADADVEALPEVTGQEAAVLDEPIALVAHPGDDRLWVAERAGTVRILEPTTGGRLAVEGDPVLDLSEETTTEAERGLLGMAFSPDGAVLYVSYTDRDGTSIVAAYPVVEGEIDPDEGEVLLDVDQPYPNHNGGHLVTTSDGSLWLGLGDGGAADDPENRAQDPDSLLGKLLRVDLTGDEDHEVVASGLRNPWRFSFDTDGTIWIADVGQNEVEEVNRVAADALEGANFGWSGYEGDRPYLDGDGRRPDDPVMPVFTYTHEGGNCSITGGFVYRGPVVGLNGAYLYADYCAGRVKALVDDGDGVVEVDLGIEVDAPISFGADRDGEAYVLSAAGPVIRIVAA
jgi:glucose/arabinose dehydrogenase